VEFNKPTQQDLYTACKLGLLPIVKDLVEIYELDVRASDNYALSAAARSGHLEVVEYLVGKGADVRASDDWALCGAAENGHLEVVKYLVSQGVDVRTMSNYALRWARICNHNHVVDYIESLNKSDN
jgi:ankyrin repeat protein